MKHSTLDSFLPEIGASHDKTVSIKHEYPLDPSKFADILHKISQAGKDTNLYLRRNCLEINGTRTDGMATSHLAIGVVVSGHHLGEGKDPHGVYLVVIRHVDSQTKRELQPDVNLVDLLREYII